MNSIPSNPVCTWFVQLLDMIDQVAFRHIDLDATARGWQVHRNRRFSRTYRDPRWDLVSQCPSCEGSGSSGARACERCGGAGRIRQEPAPSVGVT